MNDALRLLCVSCGMEHSRGDRFCEYCGARLATSGDDKRDHSEVNLGSVAGVTDRGRVHDRNEDALFISAPRGGAVAVVCDGVSTSSHPHRASQLAADVAGRVLAEALQSLHPQAETYRDWDPEAATAAAVTAAQHAVAGIERLGVSSALPPACTLVSALWDGERVTVGWIGDSRAYWLAPREAESLTVDDSWAQERLDSGEMTMRTVHADPRAHWITRWLGADSPDAAPGIASFAPDGPGRVVICTDGLWNYASSPEQLAALADDSAPETSALMLAQTLSRAALAKGGHDNVTVAVVTIGEPAPSEEERS